MKRHVFQLEHASRKGTEELRLLHLNGEKWREEDIGEGGERVLIHPPWMPHGRSLTIENGVHLNLVRPVNGQWNYS